MAHRWLKAPQNEPVRSGEKMRCMGSANPLMSFSRDLKLRSLILSSLLTILSTSGALAQQADHYIAMSNTAMSVTGDVWLDDFSIKFENGESLEFSDLVADHFSVDGRNVPASVYRVKEPGDPELQNGNQLCGAGDVTFVASWADGSESTAIAVFNGKRAPRSSNEMCALYTFEDPK